MTEDQKALVNVSLTGDLGKPANTLIEKISNAIGLWTEPKRILKNAKAEAEARVILAKADAKVSDIRFRAAHRISQEEIQDQENIESIVKIALSNLKDGAKPEEMNSDWIRNFFGKSKLYSDDDMRLIWGKLLSEEANNPGSISRRTVNLLSDIDKTDAEDFVNVCKFSIESGEFMPFITDVNKEVYQENGLSHMALKNLESIGLISYYEVSSIGYPGCPQQFKIDYCGKTIKVFSEIHPRSFDSGRVSFTKIGHELRNICEFDPVPGFPEFICNSLIKRGDYKAEILP